MLQLNTKIFKPIEFEIDGKIYQTRKLVNRVMIEGQRIALKLQDKNTSSVEAFELMVDLIVLYTPLARDFVMDNMDASDINKIISHITEETDKAVEGEAQLPLAGGDSGDASPK